MKVKDDFLAGGSFNVQSGEGKVDFGGCLVTRQAVQKDIQTCIEW